MNKLNPEKQKQNTASLSDENSIRATVRISVAAKNTIVNLLAEVRKACSEYKDKAFNNFSGNRTHSAKIDCDK
ncbi:MAG: hypothetical protein A2X59_03220 [Nitrospirae bacterium GWC2_42_7]|nr:MAG: hypothetical protein A2X59_03220 [Nitrospirae bacterium GWC2_42_7]